MARRRRPHPEHANHDRWLISYADFITLLFAFFVVMFASARADQAKVRQMSSALRSAIENGATAAPPHVIKSEPRPLEKETVPPPGDPAAELAPAMNELKGVLAGEIKDGKLDVHLDQRGLIISLRQGAFFPSGGDDISTSGYEAVSKIAKVIASLPNPVRLEGHTDSVPIHTDRFPSNWELSAARSISVLNLLSSRFGLARNRFGIAGYADTFPVDSNTTGEGREHNRRVDITILNQNSDMKADPGRPGAPR